MISICATCGKTYHNNSQHYCVETNYIKSSCGFVSFVPSPSPYELEVKTRVINNLNKLRSLSQNCQYMIPAICGLVAEIQADINILWSE